VLEFQIAQGIRVTDVIDVVLVAVLLWAALSWLRRARARIALAGVGILTVAFLLARQLELQMTVWILQGFFAVVVIVLAVVFQDDLRRLFEQIALWGLRRKPPAAPLDAVDAIVGAVRQLVAEGFGALLVIPGREPLDRHVAGGIPLAAIVSEPLLLSLFDPHSPGHDGAVTVEGDRAMRFAVHLPLSTDQAQLGAGGTRHAAALGLAERTDALAIVVSEERRTVSIARDGRLRTLAGPELLAREIRRFLAERGPKPVERRSRAQLLARRWPEALLALAASASLWLLLVPGSTRSEFERSVPVVVENLPAGYAIESIEPTEVEVLFEGRRRDFFLGQQARLSLRVDALLVQLGRRTFDVGPQHVQHPEGMTPLRVVPTRIKLNVVQSNAGLMGPRRSPSARYAQAGWVAFGDPPSPLASGSLRGK
jgi:diadenylate cyclase